jgi:hypothetical protein
LEDGKAWLKYSEFDLIQKFEVMKISTLVDVPKNAMQNFLFKQYIKVNFLNESIH